jgi:hypothetical protein
VFSRTNYRQRRIGFVRKQRPTQQETEEVMSATLINLIIQLIAGARGGAGGGTLQRFEPGSRRKIRESFGGVNGNQNQ